MASEWREGKLSDLVHFSNGKNNTSRDKSAPYPVYGSNGIIGFCNEFNAEKNTIIIGRVGSYCGSVYFSKSVCWITDNAIKGKCIGKNNALFIFYLLKHLNINNWREGSGQPLINQKILSNLPVSVPNLSLQKAIAHILGSLDDKIELNRQMNATLEAMAQTLFKSWFVDFDPVIDNALAASNPIPDELQSKAAARLALGDARKPLPTEIQALFPSSFVLTEELGWIPEGWEVCDFSKIALTNSESWSNKNTPKFVTYVDLSNAKNGRISEVIQYEFENAPSRARRVLRQDDTIIGLVRPANKSFAYIFESGLTGSTGFAVMRPKCEFYRAFIYLSLTQQETIDYFAHIADGGAYPAIRPEVVTNQLITKPTNTKVIESFDRIVYPFFKKIGLNDQSSKICSEKRDTLLPKLLSGELRIPDVESYLNNDLPIVPTVSAQA